MNIVILTKSLMQSAGPLPLMYLMIALSVLSVAIILERAWVFHRVTEDPESLARDLRSYLAQADVVGARARMASSASPEAAVLAAGLDGAERGAKAASEAMAAALSLMRLKLERRLSFLGTLGNNAPFIGLLGTVVGIVMAFDKLGAATGDARSAVPTEVMSSIAEALVATAIGLAVAIPAVAAFNHFQRRIKVMTTNADALGNLLLSYLHGEAQSDVQEVRSWQ
jgi:biopolymer transport protein ExbB/TolQ